mgnify:FL=1
MRVNFKEYFREDDLLSGNVLRLINETQKNINTNNKKETKNNENYIQRNRGLVTNCKIK